ncbi:MAG TPA: universal stress protein [Candidatus Acidoferrales bacterium]|nr:universal stress protein [Candidatus Acidoferrales bacterium]
MGLPKLILAPVDFSDHSHAAVDVAADYALRLGADLLLVHAVPAIPKLPSPGTIFREAEYEDALHKEAERSLQLLAQDLVKKGLRVRTEVGIANDVGMEIIRMAEDNHADLIVIATHGMTGWHKLAFGSVAEKVVKMAPGPVLVLRSQVKSEQATASQASQPAATR